MHSKRMHVTSDELTHYLEAMINLLQDRFMLRDDNDAQKAVVEIRKVCITIALQHSR